MERADEPPPPILLYRFEFGCIWGAKGSGVRVGGGEKIERSETRRVEARRSLVDHVNECKRR